VQFQSSFEQGNPQMKKDVASSVVSQLMTEDIIPLDDARKELQALTGQRFCKPTVWRWAIRGCGGTKLETFKVGRAIMTSRQAVTRFIVARSR
jgi:hypothetical protein